MFKPCPTLYLRNDPSYKHFIDALIRIPKEEGWMALYNGGFAAVLKAAIGTTGQLAVYDHVCIRLQLNLPHLCSICYSRHFNRSKLSFTLDL